MRIRIPTFPLRTLASAGAAAALLAGCEQTEQTLPFEASTEPVTRSIPEGGGLVGSTAGAAFRLPAGSVPAGTEVTLRVAPNPAAPASGMPAAPHSFSLDAGGAALALPASAEFRLPRQHPQGWLAAAVVATPQGTIELGEAGVDVATGILRVALPAFGTVTPVFPAPDAVVTVGRIAPGTPAASTAPAGAAAASAAGTALTPTRALLGDCGGAGGRCTGLVLDVSANLYDYASLAAAVFPVVSGRIDIAGAAASGTLRLHSPLRLRLHSGANAVTIPVTVTLTATPQTVVTETPGAVTLAAVQVRVDSSQGVAEETMTVVVAYDGSSARLTIEREIGAHLAGASETAAFAATIPLVRVP